MRKSCMGRDDILMVQNHRWGTSGEEGVAAINQIRHLYKKSPKTLLPRGIKSIFDMTIVALSSM